LEFSFIPREAEAQPIRQAAFGFASADAVQADATEGDG